MSEKFRRSLKLREILVLIHVSKAETKLSSESNSYAVCFLILHTDLHFRFRISVRVPTSHDTSRLLRINPTSHSEEKMVRIILLHPVFSSPFLCI